MKTVWGKTGNSITLPCLVSSGDEKFSLDWRKDGQLVLSAFGNEPGHVTPSLQGRIARDNGIGLTVHSLVDSDVGVYQCVVTRFTKQPTKPEWGSSVKVVVNVAPQIVYPSNDDSIYRQIGSDVSVECRAEGAPPPEVTWTRNDKIVSASPVLQITNLTENDKGRYTCLAANIEGRRTSSIEINFNKETTLDLIPTNKTVVEGANVFWHCHANSQPDVIVYNWLFERKPIKTTQAGLRANIRLGDLSLQDVRKSDSGWYTCEARSMRGELTQSSAYLHVLFAPEASALHKPVQTIASGKNATVLCDVEADPIPQFFTWSKNGHFLTTTTNRNLDILNARTSDGGIYGCQAENMAGKSLVIETHVIVAEPPVFSVKPPSEMRVRQGESIQVPCEGFGDPMPIVYWIRNQSTKPQSARQVNTTCTGPTSFHISWIPGYDGGFQQTFALHMENVLTSESRTITTSSNSTSVAELDPFTSYRFTVESRNIRGAVNSTSQTKNSCSILESPSRVLMCGPSELCWTPVKGAKSYRVETKMRGNKEFRPAGEVFEEYYRFGSDVEPSTSFDVRVRSLRPAYSPSPPSHALHVGPPDNIEVSLVYALFGGILFVICLLCLYTGYRCYKQRHLKKRSRESTPKSINNFGFKSTGSSQPGTETFYEPSLRLLDDIDSEWRGPRDDALNIRYPQSLIEYEFEIGDELPAPVDDMLRDKYIYGAQDLPPQLFNDLRIERLRREFKQSQL